MGRVTATEFKSFFFIFLASLYFIVCEPVQHSSTAFFMTSIWQHGDTWIAVHHGINYTVCIVNTCKNFVWKITLTHDEANIKPLLLFSMTTLRSPSTPVTSQTIWLIYIKTLHSKGSTSNYRNVLDSSLPPSSSTMLRPLPGQSFLWCQKIIPTQSIFRKIPVE